MKDEALAARCRALKLILTDVDGVMTDGTRPAAARRAGGEGLPHPRRPRASCSRSAPGLRTGLLSRPRLRGRGRAAPRSWAWRRAPGRRATRRSGLARDPGRARASRPDEVAYIGDDVNDLPVLARSGSRAAPADAPLEVRLRGVHGHGGARRAGLPARVRGGDPARARRLGAAVAGLGRACRRERGAAAGDDGHRPRRRPARRARGPARGARVGGRAGAASRASAPASARSPHYTQGLHYLAAGQLELARSASSRKVAARRPRRRRGPAGARQPLREAGQVERAIQIHQALLARADLTRAERAHSARQPRHRLPQGRLPRPRRRAPTRRPWPSTRGTSTRSPASRSCTRSSASGARPTRSRRASRRLRKSRRRPRARLPAGGDGPGGAARRTARRGRARVPDRALARPPRLPRPPRPRRPLDSSSDPAARPRRSWRARSPPRRSAPTSPSTASRGAYAAAGEPSRFVGACERIIRAGPARLARAARPRPPPARRGAAERGARACCCARSRRTPRCCSCTSRSGARCARSAPRPRAGSATWPRPRSRRFYVDPHICTACRYRADDMLWRCPHCHEWNTFVEERLGPAAGAR